MSHSQESNLLNTFDTCYEDLKAFLTRKFGCPDLAADVAQETWLRAQQVKELTAVNNPRAYLFKMAANLAFDSLRSDKVRTRLTSAESIPDGASSGLPLPDQIVDYQQRLEILRQAVDELPPRCREVFSLHKFKGLSHAEIAARLGISKNMVEKHIIRGLTHCRDRLQQAIQ